MNVSIRNLLACAILLTVGRVTYAEYAVDAYCTLVADGTKLASTEDCQTYYTCQNGIGIKGTCSSTQAYDKDQQSCRPKSDVSCYFSSDEPCLGKSESFAPVVGTCNGYIYCVNGKEQGRGVCPPKTVFSPSTNGGSCITGDCNDNINQGNTNEGLTSVCEIMPQGIFFGSTKNCQIWQTCNNKGLYSDLCPAGYVFDVQLSRCNFATTPNLCTRVTGQDIQPDPTPTEPCTAAQVNNVKADSAVCSQYFKCDGTKWNVVSCSKGYYFDTISGACKLRQLATPADNCNRCEFTNKQFVNAVDAECRKYQYCKNGVVKSTNSCAIGTYFDEASQACVQDTSGLSNYAANNGACHVSPPAACATVCAGLSGTECAATSDCKCTLSGNNCIVDCPATCTGLTVAECSTVDGCTCGLDSAGATCELCNAGVETDGKCTVPPPPTCAATCAAATPCANSGDCFCADNAGTCEEDCVTTCGSMTQDVCVNKAGCTCTSDGTTCKKA